MNQILTNDNEVCIYVFLVCIFFAVQVLSSASVWVEYKLQIFEQQWI